MNDYDDYITGLHDDFSPMNIQEIDIEELSPDERLEIMQNHFEKELRNEKSRKEFHLKNAKEASGIWKMFRVTGKLTEEEISRMNALFQPYLKQ